jgi:hypothetical protein
MYSISVQVRSGVGIGAVEDDVNPPPPYISRGSSMDRVVLHHDVSSQSTLHFGEIIYQAQGKFTRVECILLGDM